MGQDVWSLAVVDLGPRQRQKMIALDQHASSHGLLASCDQAAFVLLATVEKLPVHIGHVRGFRHWHPVIAPKVSGLSFDAPLFVWLGPRRSPCCHRECLELDSFTGNVGVRFVPVHKPRRNELRFDLRGDSRFATSSAFASWLGLCPDNRIGGGKVLSVHTRVVKNRVAMALRMASQSLHRSHSFLGDYYRRMRAKLGKPKAITAAAHKLARLSSTCFRRDKPMTNPFSRNTSRNTVIATS